MIEAQETEVRILQKYIREYYKYTKTYNIFIIGIDGAPFTKASVYDATVHVTCCSDRWHETIACRAQWMEVSDWFVPTVDATSCT